MTCSILIPTRARPVMFRQAINAICLTATSSDFEILVRYDDDDVTMIGCKQWLGEYASRVRCICGPRRGYGEIDSHYYATLEQEAKGEFVWIASDDMIVSGDWLGELKKVPKTGYIVQPEISKLGHSTYVKAEGQAFPIFPRNCWNQYADKFPSPFDFAGDKLLRENGWQTWFLKGVTMWHDRPNDDALKQHRK